MKKTKKKTKDLKLRLSEDLMDELHDVTDNMSLFVREAIRDKIDAMQYSTNSTQSIRIKEIELIIESKKTQLKAYEEIIAREKQEIETLEAEKKRYEKEVLKQETDNKDRLLRITSNPTFINEMNENIKLILRKKYLHIEVSLNNTYNKRAQNAQINVEDYKKLLLDHFSNDYYVGQNVKLANDNIITLTNEDIDYVKHRLN